MPNGGHFELPEDWWVGDLPNSGNGVSVRTESLHHRQVIKYLETQCFSLYWPVHCFQMLSLVVKRGSMTVEGKMDPGQLAPKQLA